MDSVRKLLVNSFLDVDELVIHKANFPCYNFIEQAPKEPHFQHDTNSLPRSVFLTRCKCCTNPPISPPLHLSDVD